MVLSPVQVRILGCLMEKERTTPDVYPLTMNSLLTACNQSTNRFPVVRLDENTVSNALTNLRAMDLVRIVYSRSNRAEKWRHVLPEVLDIDAAEAALMCVLMLRGPQTASELRSRTERLHPFAGQDEVDDSLRILAAKTEPLVARLERQPGQKENRWAQLLGGELPADMAVAASTTSAASTSSSGAPGPSRSDRIAELEASVEELREELAKLRADHDALAAELR